MNVLYLTNIPSPYRVDFFNEMSKYCNLTVLYERYNAKNREDGWTKRDVICYREHVLPGIPVGEEGALNPSVLRYIRKYQNDIIVVGGYSTPTGMLAIWRMNRKGIPYLINIDGGIIKKDSAPLRRIKQYFLSHAAGYLCSGDAGAQYLHHYQAGGPIYQYPFTSLRRRDLLETPPSQEEKRSLREKLGMTEQKIVLGVGQFVFRKGFDLLLTAARQLDGETGIYLVGGDPPGEYLELARKIDHAAVHFLQFMDKRSLWDYYRAADIFVLPTREDIWGLVVNEAMACGLPVVTTTACVAGSELIEDGVSGRILPPENSRALADCIRSLFCDRPKLHRMGAAALIRISTYTIENMAQEHAGIFQEYEKMRRLGR